MSYQVLVAEDDRCLYNAIYRCLRAIDKDVQCIWATTADEAQMHLEQRAFDLVISDYTLCGLKTGMDLWETCRRKNLAHRFLMISGMGVGDFIRITGRSNRIPFLPKPFSVNDLTLVVAGIL